MTRLIQDDVDETAYLADQTLDHQRPARIRAQRRGHQATISPLSAKG
ncbi:hypothetical protein LNP17_22860 [Klebsiella variicola subsp. variicola]|nr:hypothetical protein [Klebsiella variicola subsp. variicola]